MNNIKVELKTDLTKYGEGLIAGIKGITIGQQGIWSRSNDNFITVKFENNIILDILWNSLEIIDEEYLQKLSKTKTTYLKELKTATNIIKTIGPKGGFKYLSFEYTRIDGCHWSKSIGLKKEADKLLDVFSEYKLNVKIQKII
ncbi:hypothetical protein KPL42_15065 [Clostridium gasigenes]|uniref:hypothetical protein n=1 Tax=Clostridium gasigenes TaxID=94869 RepID=UPI001C0D6B57|nr:hypothetical protein [Clostridium gasigenes]MBU3089805.1 hypothetical protein [Clostridium gasigenes]